MVDKPKMEHDWDARDFSNPLTVVGVLSYTIHQVVVDNASIVKLEAVIDEVLRNPTHYRW